MPSPIILTERKAIVTQEVALPDGGVYPVGHRVYVVCAATRPGHVLIQPDDAGIGSPKPVEVSVHHISQEHLES